MADNRFASGSLCGNNNSREAVSINADKIFDSCKDKDCMENLRVFLTRSGQAILDRAMSVKPKSAEVIDCNIDVSPVPFNRGFFTIDIRFFFKVTCDACIGPGRPQTIEGLSTCDKRVILFGSEGNVKMFTSGEPETCGNADTDLQSNNPRATVDVVDPIILNAMIVEGCDESGTGCDMTNIPESVNQLFNDSLVDSNEFKQLVCTLGLFSIVRLQRKVQLLIPSYDFSIPEKECTASGEETPCNLFNRINFPTNEFFPLRLSEFLEQNGTTINNR